MRLLKAMKTIKYIAAFVAIILLIGLTGCCEAKYNYYSYKKKAEEALLAKDFKKAKKLFSVIYTNETKRKTVNAEHTTWAFYRLGVVAELTGDIDMARGYYWGDRMDEGFYEEFPQTNWFAQGGWKQMDEIGTSRTLEEILAFEKTSPSKEEPVVERKKEEIVPKKYSAPKLRPDTTGIITKTYNRSRTRPDNDTPQPMMVYY